MIFFNCSNKKSLPEKKSTVVTSASVIASSTVTLSSSSVASKPKPKLIPPRPRGMYTEILFYFKICTFLRLSIIVISKAFFLSDLLISYVINEHHNAFIVDTNVVLVLSSSRDLWKQWLHGCIKFHWRRSWSSKAETSFSNCGEVKHINWQCCLGTSFTRGQEASTTFCMSFIFSVSSVATQRVMFDVCQSVWLTLFGRIVIFPKAFTTLLSLTVVIIRLCCWCIDITACSLTPGETCIVKLVSYPARQCITVSCCVLSLCVVMIWQYSLLL